MSLIISRFRPAAAGLVLLSALVLCACGGSGDSLDAGSAVGSTDFDVTIRRTSFGIPRLKAGDFASLGYGYGYALAQDNICTMADIYVTVSAQRSRFFGPDGSYAFTGNGTTHNNLNTDFFFQRVIDEGRVEVLVAAPPPEGPLPQVKELIRGYVAGYNRYLRDTGVDNLSDPRCRGEPWVRPITEIDAYRRFYQLASLASSGTSIDGIGSAQPPATGGDSAPLPDPQAVAEQLGIAFESLPIGSNAVALGREATANGRGMLLGNPHFPWIGGERFYEVQFTIPGLINVSGASLFGVPLVLIGHTDSLAWSHTVSSAFRFTPFQLTLVPGSPTSYLVDGQPEAMQSREVTVQVRTEDGDLESRSRTLYSTRYGPMVNSILDLPLFPWTPVTAFTIRDANDANFRYVNHFLETNMAHSVAEQLAILERNQGIPWVNTIAADKAGNAFYADISVVPNVPDTHALTCAGPLGLATFPLIGLPVLDGSRSTCNWQQDADAIQPGTFGPANMPHVTRADYVTNSNDSYWLSNPEQPLTGFARIIGDENTPRRLRTRSGLVMIRERLAGEGKFTRQDLQDLLYSNRQYAAELWRDPLIELCSNFSTLVGSNGPVDVSAACPVLADWDGRDDIDSRGALLFRRFVDNLLLFSLPTGSSASLDLFSLAYTEPFNPADAVDTPRGLNILNPLVQQALADAVTDLRGNDIPLDARLGEYQYELRNGERIPIHGGPGTLGVFNAINVTWQPPEGYVNVPQGSSFIQVVSFTDGDCPDTRNILTYSQSTNPESEHFDDQTRLYSRKQWVDEPFCEAEILADPNLTVRRLQE